MKEKRSLKKKRNRVKVKGIRLQRHQHQKIHKILHLDQTMMMSQRRAKEVETISRIIWPSNLLKSMKI